MSSKWTIFSSLIISLLGHLIIVTTFSITTFNEIGRFPLQFTSISFIGELAEKRNFPVTETVVRKIKPQLKPEAGGPEKGPDFIPEKLPVFVPMPAISAEEISSIARKEETRLLEISVGKERKPNPSHRTHLEIKEEGK